MLIVKIDVETRYENSLCTAAKARRFVNSTRPDSWSDFHIVLRLRNYYQFPIRSNSLISSIFREDTFSNRNFTRYKIFCKDLAVWKIPWRRWCLNGHILQFKKKISDGVWTVILQFKKKISLFSREISRAPSRQSANKNSDTLHFTNYEILRYFRAIGPFSP